MLIVSLTGGIATGKSIAARVLEDLGCHIHHADQAAHLLMRPHQPAWEQIVAHFGASVLKSDKTIDRTKLGAIIFSDNKERLFLNRLLHPLIFQKKKEEIARLQAEGKFKIFISEAALTIEAGYAGFFDKIVLTHCPKKIQISRLMRRDKIDRTEAINKIESQTPSEEKLKYADYVIDTSGTIQETVEQSERVFRSLMSDYDLLHKQ
jgi:dephospho-CoA kinase